MKDERYIKCFIDYISLTVLLLLGKGKEAKFVLNAHYNILFYTVYFLCNLVIVTVLYNIVNYQNFDVVVQLPLIGNFEYGNLLFVFSLIMGTIFFSSVLYFFCYLKKENITIIGCLRKTFLLSCTFVPIYILKNVLKNFLPTLLHEIFGKDLSNICSYLDKEIFDIMVTSLAIIIICGIFWIKKLIFINDITHPNLRRSNLYISVVAMIVVNLLFIVSVYKYSEIKYSDLDRNEYEMLENFIYLSKNSVDLLSDKDGKDMKELQNQAVTSIERIKKNCENLRKNEFVDEDIRQLYWIINEYGDLYLYIYRNNSESLNKIPLRISDVVKRIEKTHQEMEYKINILNSNEMDSAEFAKITKIVQESSEQVNEIEDILKDITLFTNCQKIKNNMTEIFLMIMNDDKSYKKNNYKDYIIKYQKLLDELRCSGKNIDNVEQKIFEAEVVDNLYTDRLTEKLIRKMQNRERDIISDNLFDKFLFVNLIKLYP